MSKTSTRRRTEELYAQDQFGGVRGLDPLTPPTADFSRWIVIATYDQQRKRRHAVYLGHFPAFAVRTGAAAANAFEKRQSQRASPSGAAVLGDDQLGLNREVYDFKHHREYQFADEWTFTTVKRLPRIRQS